MTITPAYKYLADLYLDWVNNYGSTITFAEHHGITTKDAERLIGMGRNVHEQLVAIRSA